MTERTVVELHDVHRTFGRADSSTEVRAVDGIDFSVTAGEFLAVMGASGSGKSTLLYILGCLDRPTKGHYLLDGKDISTLDDDSLSEVRNERIGFVFQTFNLIPQLNVLENVKVPLIYSHREVDTKQCVDMIAAVGLEKRMSHLPRQLSGGETQRVAIARALVNDPTLILADEPTGNLDSKSSGDILDVLEALNAQGRTIIMVTHEETIARRTHRIVHMKDGKIFMEERPER